MKVEDIKKVTIIGAGIMGHGIAQGFAQHGYLVTLRDVQEGILQKALSQISENLDTFIKYGLTTEKAKKQTLSRIKITTDLAEAVSQADFILEAISEDLVAKQQLLSEIERLCPGHAIIASNTSTLTLKAIGSGSRRQERLVIAHWMNPPHILPVVEVVRGPQTSDEVFECTFNLVGKIGKKPVKIMKEVPGFVHNRILHALFREALALLGAGVASAEDIDMVIKGGFGFRLPTLGVFETADLGGVDFWLKVTRQLMPVIDRSTEPPQWLEDMVKRGEVGAKSGQGFYKYSKKLLSDKVAERDRQFLERLKDLYSAQD